MSKLEMPMYVKGDIVRCVELSQENTEDLKLYEDYTVKGYSYFGKDIVYALMDTSGNLKYAMGGHFYKMEMNPCKELPEPDVLPRVGEDMVNHPSHYCDGGIETIDFIKAKLTPQQFEGYLIGNILKYMSRAGKKGDDVEDLKKAQWYLNKLIDTLEPQMESPMTQKQQGYIAGLTTTLHMDRTNLPNYISPIPDYHNLTEEQASMVIDRLLTIKSFLEEAESIEC